MPQARGRKAQLLLDIESTFGQNPGSPDAKKMPFVSAGLSASQKLIADESIRNRRDAAIPGRGNIDVSGSIVVPVDKIAFGWWMRLLFGAPTTTGSGPYTHTWKFLDTQPSGVLELGYTDIAQYLLYNGCKISKFSLPFGGDAEVRATFDIMGAAETLGGVSYDATPTAIVEEKFSMFQLSLKEGGTTIAYALSGELSMDMNLDGDQYTIGNAGKRYDIPEGVVVITGNIKTLFQGAALLNKAINGDETSLQLTWTSGAHSLDILLQELMFERKSPGVEGSKGILIDLPFTAYYQNGAAGSAIQVTLVNTQQSYA